jgi:outer membrane protein assembly factor BamD
MSDLLLWRALCRWTQPRSPAWAALLCALLVAACGSTSKDLPPGIAAEKLYAEARDDMSAGSWERAIKAMERVEGLAAGTLLAQQAQLDMAYMHWRNGERESALTTIERFIKLNPSSPALDYALYLRGVINFNDSLGLLGTLARQDLSERDQRASRDAWQAFRQLVEQFPESRYADDARLRMNYIVNTLASYEVHVARYYFRRGAYVAAANRAQQAVAEFQHAPAAEEALYLMVQSYDKLGLADLRDAADRVLRRNFPNSAFLTRGLEARNKPWWRFWQ